MLEFLQVPTDGRNCFRCNGRRTDQAIDLGAVRVSVRFEACLYLRHGSPDPGFECSTVGLKRRGQRLAEHVPQLALDSPSDEGRRNTHEPRSFDRRCDRSEVQLRHFPQSGGKVFFLERLIQVERFGSLLKSCRELFRKTREDEVHLVTRMPGDIRKMPLK